MKKTVKLLSLLLALSLLFSLFSCGDAQTPEEEKPADTYVTLVLEDKSDNTPDVYEVKISELAKGEGIIPLLTYVSEKNGLEFAMRGDGVIEKIAHLENDYSKNSYIYVYTSLDADKDVSAYRSTVNYNGVTLTSAGVGVSDMHLEDGVIIYVGLINF